MDKAHTQDQPYIIFPTNNSTLIVSPFLLITSIYLEHCNLHWILHEILDREHIDRGGAKSTYACKETVLFGLFHVIKERGIKWE